MFHGGNTGSRRVEFRDVRQNLFQVYYFGDSFENVFRERRRRGDFLRVRLSDARRKFSKESQRACMMMNDFTRPHTARCSLSEIWFIVIYFLRSLSVCIDTRVYSGLRPAALEREYNSGIIFSKLYHRLIRPAG